MKEYIKAQTRTNDTILENIYSSDELNRFSKSDYRWADNRKKTLQFRTVKKGEIYQFEFGKNYIPEMSYEHRGLVIGVKKKLLYVLPIFSYSPTKHPDVYHPIDYPNSKSDMFLLKNNEFPFITHDSVLKLNDIRTVSINRILYQHTGRINLNSDTYRQIESLALQKYFPEVHYKLAQKNAAITSLNEDKKKLTEGNAALITENLSLKEALKSLQAKLSISDKADYADYK
ncbi:MAG: type II toxin-antitoxin system PemK/MazF family toxin [Eubacterium sp.]|nr:type II toxin-antitoxin system PemK/MazF family toxin [Eubacterium sp.]